MPARNGKARFGWVSRALHWLMALGLAAAFALGLRIAHGEISLAALGYFGLHKSLGITLLLAALLRLAWHRLTPPPAPIEAGMARWQLALGRVVHRSFYVLMLAIPLTGWFASSATGPDVVVFGLVLPKIAPTSETLASQAFAVHQWLGYLLAFLVCLHVAGALHRAMLHHDGSLRRILTG